MRRFIIALVCLMGLGGLGLPEGSRADFNVTNNPNVTGDLAVARSYWNTAAPTLSTQCAIEVMVGEMMPTEVEGTKYAANEVWGETPLNGCKITIANSFWEGFTKLSADVQVTEGGIEITPYIKLCVILVHEYGHTLGLPDSFIPENGVMSPNESVLAVPPCDYVSKIETPTEIVEREDEEHRHTLMIQEREEITAERSRYERLRECHEKSKRKRPKLGRKTTGKWHKHLKKTKRPRPSPRASCS